MSEHKSASTEDTLGAEQLTDAAPELAPRRRDPDGPPPARLGHYVLLDRLGAGAMGVVHAAYDTKLDRKVALKLLHAHGSEHAQHRLVREAQAMAKLSHPNIVQIYEIGELAEDPSALAFIVMEFVDGVTLRQWFTERPRTRVQVLAVMIEAGRGLAAAHAQGLVHRDFKPDNVMVRRDGRVLVMDFGLARGQLGDAVEHVDAALSGLREREVERSQELTAVGAIMGTPAYMAPEQFHGREADARADQFAFCVSLWEALYRRRPFAGPTLHELSQAVTSGQLTSPPRGDVPGWLHAVLLRGLAVEPDRRWPSMPALLDALQRDPTRRRRLLASGGAALLVVLAGLAGWQWQRGKALEQTIAACEQDGQAIAAEWNDEVRATLEQAFLASDNSVAGSLWPRAAAAMDAYTSEWTALRTNTCLDAQVERTLDDATYAQVVACLDEHRETVAGVLDAWAAADGQTVVGASMAVAGLPPLSTCTNEAALAHRKQAPVEIADRVAQLQGRIRRAAGLKQAGDYEQALAQLRAIEAEAQTLGYKPIAAETSLAIAATLTSLGKSEDARVAAEQSLFDGLAGGDDLAALAAAIQLIEIVGAGLAQHENGRRWQRFASTMLERLELGSTLVEASLLLASSRMMYSEGLFEQSLEHLGRALELHEQLLGPDHLLVANTLNSIGAAMWELGRYDEALAAHRRALAIRVAVLGENHPNVAGSYNNIGLVLWDSGEYEQALEAHRRSLAINEAAFGPRNFDVGTSYNNIGLVQWNQGALDEALDSFARALDIWQAELGPEHPDVGLIYNNVGLVLNQQGQLERALLSHQRALEIYTAAFGAEHPRVAQSHNNIGIVLLEQGKIDDALAAYDRALAIQELVFDPPHPSLAQTLGNIGIALMFKGEYERARDYEERALDMLRITPGPEHPEFADSLHTLGELAFLQGDDARARELLEQALAIRTKAKVAPAATAITRLCLGRALWELGEHEDARLQVETAERMLSEAGDLRGDLPEVRDWLRDPDRSNARARSARK